MNQIAFFRKNGYYKTPRVIQIELTTKCPLSCPQCYKDNAGSENIDFDYLKSLLYRQKEAGLKSVMLNGGEPLLYPHFFELLEFLGELEIRANCFSSGVSINDVSAAKLKKYENLFLNISLNGSTRHVNSLSRDGYFQAMNSIKALKDANVKFGINWVARKDNVYDFKNIIGVAEKNKASNILIVGNKYTSAGNMNSRLDYNELIYLNDIISDYKKKKGKVQLLIQQCFLELRNLQFKDELEINRGCPAGRIFCSVDHNGMFMPCTHIAKYERFDSVNEYLEKSKQLNIIRNMTKSFIHPTCAEKIE